MSTRRHLRAQPALECGSLLPLCRQPACWLQIVFSVESPASKLAGKKRQQAAALQSLAPTPDGNAMRFRRQRTFPHTHSIWAWTSLARHLSLTSCHCPSIFAKCAISENSSSSFFRRRSRFCRTSRSSAITRTLSKNRSTAGRRVEITSKARP